MLIEIDVYEKHWRRRQATRQAAEGYSSELFTGPVALLHVLVLEQKLKMRSYPFKVERALRCWRYILLHLLSCEPIQSELLGVRGLLHRALRNLRQILQVVDKVLFVNIVVGDRPRLALKLLPLFLEVLRQVLLNVLGVPKNCEAWINFLVHDKLSDVVGFIFLCAEFEAEE